MTAQLFLSVKILIGSMVIAASLFPSLVRAADLTLFVNKEKAVIHIRAVGAYDTTAYSIGPQAGFTEKMVQIYERIEVDLKKEGTLGKVGGFMDKQYRTVRDLFPFWKDKNPTEKKEASQTASLEQLLAEAGDLFYNPIEDLVAVSRHIEFVIAEDHLFYPFDALHAGDGPLFLTKKISYRISAKKTTALKANASWRGLIIADADNDPEKGADRVLHLFPGAFGFPAKQVKRDQIHSISSADFILVSAQGGVDGLPMENLTLRPQTLSAFQPELVYLDCDLYGLNLNFINHFNQSGVKAYVAPIFRRQAGEATSQTMIRFFRSLLNGENPTQALYLTRKTLYDAAVLDGESQLTALRRAFPFRVYRLN